MGYDWEVLHVRFNCNMLIVTQVQYNRETGTVANKTIVFKHPEGLMLEIITSQSSCQPERECRG